MLGDSHRLGNGDTRLTIEVEHWKHVEYHVLLQHRLLPIAQAQNVTLIPPGWICYSQAVTGPMQIVVRQRSQHAAPGSSETTVPETVPASVPNTRNSVPRYADLKQETRW
jgi:hypothetical protein